MALIDPDGLFNGDRFEMISDSARLAWPFLWCASNTVGRLELNYRKIIGHAFGRFKCAPTEEEFWGWIQEYGRAWLLFVYEADGTLWGQWDTSAKYLPKYQLTQDKRTPAPEPKAFNAWKDEYIEAKRQKNACKPIDINNCAKILQLSGTVSTDRDGIGIGVGIGEGEKHPPKPPKGADDLFPELTSEDPAKAQPQPARSRRHKDSPEEVTRRLGPRIAWWNEFWSIYPCKEGKTPAMRNFERIVQTEANWREVLAGAKNYAEKFRRDPTMKLKFAQGWLTDTRWTDAQPPEIGSNGAPYRPLMA